MKGKDVSNKNRKPRVLVPKLLLFLAMVAITSLWVTVAIGKSAKKVFAESMCCLITQPTANTSETSLPEANSTMADFAKLASNRRVIPIVSP